MAPRVESVPMGRLNVANQDDDMLPKTPRAFDIPREHPLLSSPLQAQSPGLSARSPDTLVLLRAEMEDLRREVRHVLADFTTSLRAPARCRSPAFGGHCAGCADDDAGAQPLSEYLPVRTVGMRSAHKDLLLPAEEPPSPIAMADPSPVALAGQVEDLRAQVLTLEANGDEMLRKLSGMRCDVEALQTDIASCPRIEAIREELANALHHTSGGGLGSSVCEASSGGTTDAGLQEASMAAAAAAAAETIAREARAQVEQLIKEGEATSLCAEEAARVVEELRLECDMLWTILIGRDARSGAEERPSFTVDGVGDPSGLGFACPGISMELKQKFMQDALSGGATSSKSCPPPTVEPPADEADAAPPAPCGDAAAAMAVATAASEALASLRESLDEMRASTRTSLDEVREELATYEAAASVRRSLDEVHASTRQSIDKVRGELLNLEASWSVFQRGTVERMTLLNTSLAARVDAEASWSSFRREVTEDISEMRLALRAQETEPAVAVMKSASAVGIDPSVDVLTDAKSVCEILVKAADLAAALRRTGPACAEKAPLEDLVGEDANKLIEGASGPSSAGELPPAARTRPGEAVFLHSPPSAASGAQGRAASAAEPPAEAVAEVVPSSLADLSMMVMRRDSSMRRIGSMECDDSQKRVDSSSRKIAFSADVAEVLEVDALEDVHMDLPMPDSDDDSEGCHSPATCSEAEVVRELERAEERKAQLERESEMAVKDWFGGSRLVTVILRSEQDFEEVEERTAEALREVGVFLYEWEVSLQRFVDTADKVSGRLPACSDDVTFPALLELKASQRQVRNTQDLWPSAPVLESSEEHI